MNEARRRLRDFQEKVFKEKALSNTFDGFDLRAYPETAIKKDLDLIGIAIRITPRYWGVNYSEKKIEESCESFRQRILSFLDAPDPELEAA